MVWTPYGIADLVPWMKEYDGDVADEALKNYCCPSCGADLEGYAEVGYKSPRELKVEETIAKAVSGKFVDRLEKFNGFLEKYPYLGAYDPQGLGRKILKAIKSAQRDKIYKSTWHRARLFNIESRLFKSSEMTAPNPKSVYIREGRYNHTGQSFLYLAEFEETALAEVSSGREDVCVIQKYELDDLDGILDLTGDYEELDPKKDVLKVAIVYNGFVRSKPQKKSSWKPEYFVPRYLADVARLHGFRGIKFSSAVSYGANLVLFNPKHRKCRQLGEPYFFEKKKVEPDGGIPRVHL